MNHVTKCAEALREKFQIMNFQWFEKTKVRYDEATTEEIEAVIRPFIEEAEREAVSGYIDRNL